MILSAVAETVGLILVDHHTLNRVTGGFTKDAG
jgi:hypothetical protein